PRGNVVAVMVPCGVGAPPNPPPTLCSLCHTAPFTYVSFVYYLEGFGGEGPEVEVGGGPEGKLGSSTHSSHSLRFPVLNKLETRDTNET
uniref:Uncharacterized protein n=1 Tax=Rhinolophus ferrumequinum TaxID=59479 RepID=A0A671EPY4_RHIFE